MNRQKNNKGERHGKAERQKKVFLTRTTGENHGIGADLRICNYNKPGRN